MNHDDILRKRGIYEAAQEANWQIDRNGWRYPIYNVKGVQHELNGQKVYRWKNTDSNGNPKCLWQPSKSETARYYVFADTYKAIEDAWGICYLASGEPDVLTFRAAGIRNVICWFDGEGSIPETLVNDLNKLGVVTLIDYPDRDKTGLTKAAHLLELLEDTDIDYSPRKLSGEVGSKNDINQLWQTVQFSVDRFKAILADCEEYEDDDLLIFLTADDAPSVQQLEFDTTPTDDGQWLTRDFIDDVIADVEKQAKFKRWKSNGWSTNFICPFHDEKIPSAGFNRETKKFKCFSSCGEMDIREYASRRGIDLSYYQQRWQQEHPPFQQKTKTELKTAPAKPAVSPQPAAPKKKLYEDSHDVLAGLVDELDGKRTPDIEPMLFPFTTLHKFGGFSKWIWPGKLVYIVGVSGGGKTSFAESIAQRLMKAGHDFLWWGPEWSPEEMRIREGQRQGGMTVEQWANFKAWQALEKRGVPEDKRRIEKPSQLLIDKTKTILQTMMAWSGRSYQFIADPELSKVDDIIREAEAVIIEKRNMGRKVTTFFVDYIQRMPKQGRGEWDRLEMVASAVKGLCERHKLFGYVLVQPNKSDSKNARENEVLRESSGQGLSDQQANLYLGLTPKFDDLGQKLPVMRVTVLKNSGGKSGEVMLDWNQETLTINDIEVKEVTVNLNNPTQSITPEQLDEGIARLGGSK